jgi:hypothetical protein
LGWDAQARKRFARVVLVDGADRVVGIGLSGVRSAERSEELEAIRPRVGSRRWRVAPAPR